MGELIPQTDQVIIRAEMGYGLTVEQMLDVSNVAAVIRPFVVVSINGKQLAPVDWSQHVLQAGEEVEIFYRPAGDSGKEILRLIATIAIIVVAWQIAGAYAGSGIFGLTAEATQFVIATTITAVGTALLNAFIPPPSVNLPTGGYDTGESYFLTNQSNRARPYAPVPVPYGRVKMIGNLAAQPEVFSAGDSSLFTVLIDWGLGQSNVFNYRAGDTKLQWFSATMKEHTNVPDWIDGDPDNGLDFVPLELLRYPLNSVELSVGLSSDGDFGIANTVPTAYSAVAELFFPQGISYFDDQGNAQNLGVTFKGEYRVAGTSEWMPWPAGTKGYAGDSHIRFGAGTVDPDDGNPNEEPNIDFSVPVAKVLAGEDFVCTISFDRAVYAVDFTDFEFLNSATGENVTGQFQKISESEITPQRVWQYVLRSPALGDEESNQYVIGTNLQNFIDEAPPYGEPFPDKVYESSAFTVSGKDAEGGGDDGGGGPVDGNLYDRTVGNETFVLVRGYYPQYTGSYVPYDKSSWVQLSFEVWVGGVKQVVNLDDFSQYVGVGQQYTSASGFGVITIQEWWSLKRADGSSTKRDFFLPPNWGGGTPFNQTFTIYGNKPQPAKASIEIIFATRGEYEIKISRIGDNSNVERPQQYVSTCYWSRMASRGYPYYPDTLDGRQSILNLQRRHTMTEIRLEASESVQGNLNEISATVVSQLRQFNPSTRQWNPPVNSRNPAWIVADLLTGYRAQQVRVPRDLQDDGGYLATADLEMPSVNALSRVCIEPVT